ncbi:MAG: chromate transporter [Ruminococcaceae bacterium]|nr:chromate transporter [Oscillospiraceae bacterium]
MNWILVFVEFFKTGLFAVGGGLATLPFLYDIADKYKWFTGEDLSKMIAVSESTPGPIGINCATYAGVTALGSIWGGIVSTIALVLPSLIVILIIAKILDKFQNNRFINYAFDGIRPAVTAMIAVAFTDVFKTEILNIGNNVNFKITELVNLPALILFAVLFVLMRKFKKIHPIVFIALSAVVGIIFKF